MKSIKYKVEIKEKGKIKENGKDISLHLKGDVQFGWTEGLKAQAKEFSTVIC